MPQLNKFVKKPSKLYRSLVATALIANGIFQLVAPALAEGTAAGQSISNQAGATYEDRNNPNTTIDVTSNTVILTVAEVAGITITANGVTDSTPTDPVKVGDTLSYQYTLTNVGNDPTNFRIPNLATVTGPGTAGNLEVSTDGGTTWKAIAGSELITNTLPGLEKGLLPGQSMLVRVPVQVTNGATNGDTITVKLGDTPGDSQNQLRNPNGGDVYTVDNPDTITTPEVAGVPANGVREASASQDLKVGSTVQIRALASVLKTRTDYQPGDLTKLNDDVLTYGLSLKVESSDPTGNGYTPAPLAGTTINVDNQNGTYILVSDAVPAGTTLTGTPIAPGGWEAVYTTDIASIPATQAKWSRSKPAGTITRIGFINKPAQLTSVAPGASVTGFSVQVVTSGITARTTVGNIAQLFGQTNGELPVDNDKDGIPDNLIFDESGDQNPNNFDPISKTFDIFDPAKDPTNSGFIDPTDANKDGRPDALDTIGTDPANNTGSGIGGEANIFVIEVPSQLVNGPEGKADAIGPSDNNDDFTNRSTLVPASIEPGTKANPATINPAAVTFTNTVKNNSADPVNVSLLPTIPTDATQLPSATLVTITSGSLSATYEYDGTKFNFKSGQGTVNGQPISATNPIRIDALAKDATASYGVEVDLPAATPLSTDIERGFPIPVTAFVDTDNNGLIDATEAKNITIDRVYTGFMKLIKESRVIKGTGPDVAIGQDVFDDKPKQPAPGNIIEFRITYKNISDAQAGSANNVILNATNIKITEDGTTRDVATGKGNNWALDNDANAEIDTSNVVGSAKDSGGANIMFYSGKPASNVSPDQTGTTQNTDITKYEVKITNDLVPGQIRTFIFQRLVNGNAPTGTAK
jgi:hypothetical protein